MNLPGPPTAAVTACGACRGSTHRHWRSDVAFAAAMIVMYFFKMQRAAKLLQQLASLRPDLGVARCGSPGSSETPVIKTSGSSILLAAQSSTFSPGSSSR